MDAMDYVNYVGEKQAKIDQLEKEIVWYVRKLVRLAKVADSYQNLKLPTEKAIIKMFETHVRLRSTYVQLLIIHQTPVPRFPKGTRYVVAEIGGGGEETREAIQRLRYLP